jgi:hypothetical protein
MNATSWSLTGTRAFIPEGQAPTLWGVEQSHCPSDPQVATKRSLHKKQPEAP